MIKIINSVDCAGLFPPRDRDSHKGSFGYVGVMGGCPEYSGAVKLANLSQAALKSGCGVSRLIVPASIKDYVGPYLLESTLCSISCDDSGKMLFDSSSLDNALAGLKSLSLGMGWGKSPEYVKIIEYIASEYSVNLILDADALNCLEGRDLSFFKESRCRIAITPHPMEFSRISGHPISEIKTNGAELAENFAQKNNCIVLLKGADTVITDGSETYISKTGTPGMATAGSGDVLAGVLAGLTGYLPMSARTIAAGAYLTGLAGELATKKCGEYSHTASDTVSMIASALSLLC